MRRCGGSLERSGASFPLVAGGCRGSQPPGISRIIASSNLLDTPHCISRSRPKRSSELIETTTHRDAMALDRHFLSERTRILGQLPGLAPALIQAVCCYRYLASKEATLVCKRRPQSYVKSVRYFVIKTSISDTGACLSPIGKSQVLWQKHKTARRVSLAPFRPWR